MENLETSPEALESAANIVDAYCRTQKSVMDTYLRNATSMQSEWVDDKTLGSLLEEIRHLNTIVSTTRAISVKKRKCCVTGLNFKDKDDVGIRRVAGRYRKA